MKHDVFEGTILAICQQGQRTETQNLKREQDNPWAHYDNGMLGTG